MSVSSKSLACRKWIKVLFLCRRNRLIVNLDSTSYYAKLNCGIVKLSNQSVNYIKVESS